MERSARPLLIGIGNRLRGDDGAGYRLAERLEIKPDPSATPWQVLAVQQLIPELAPAIARADAVLFVDAWRLDGSDGQPGGPRPSRPLLEPIGGSRRTSRWPEPHRHRLSHQCTPGQLLELCGALYGQPPPAWQLLLPARQLGHGATLSPTTIRALAEGLQLVRQWRPSDA